MKYSIAQCFDEWPEAQNKEQAAHRQFAREVYETINPMTLAERIAYAQSESPENFELAAFLDLGVFISFYMPELIKLPFGEHHPQFFNLIPRGQRASRHNVIAPRGFAKSQINAVCYPLHCIAYKHVYDRLGLQADHFIIVISRNYDDAARRVRDIKDAVEMKFPDLVGRKTWGAKTTVTKNNVSMLADSPGGRIRGALFNTWRPTLIICDDLDDMSALSNPRTAAEDEIWFNSDLMECGSSYTNFVNIDTVKSRDAFTMKLAASPTWETTFIRAVSHPEELEHPTSEFFWNEYRKIFSNKSLDIKTRHEKADEYYKAHRKDMDDGVVELWPQHISYRQLREKGFDQGLANVLREFQGYPEDLAYAVFDMKKAVRFNANLQDENVKISKGIQRSDGRFVKWNQFAGATIFADWANIEDIKSNRFASVVTVVWEPLPPGGYDNPNPAGVNGYIFDAWIGRGGRDTQITALIDAYRSITGYLALQNVPQPTYRIVCENFKDAELKDIQIKHYDTIARANKVDVKLEFKARSENAQERISALQLPIVSGWLAFNDHLPPDFLHQLEGFPQHPFNDGLDACEGAWSVPVTENMESRMLKDADAKHKASDEYKRRQIWGPIYRGRR